MAVDGHEGQSVVSYGVERFWQPRNGARHGLLPNSAGTGGKVRLVPIFFTGQKLLTGKELPKTTQVRTLVHGPHRRRAPLGREFEPVRQRPADRRGRTGHRYNRNRLKTARVPGPGARHRAQTCRALHRQLPNRTAALS
jgi:hypothetical protein